MTDPDNIISASFSADNVIDWTPFYSDNRFDFWFNPETSQITEPPYHVLIPANVRIEPETLNLKSKGVITAFVKLPEPYNVNDIIVSSVICETCAEGGVAPALKGVVADNTLILKFNRQDLRGLVPGEKVELRLRGNLTDGSIFIGKDMIRVMN